MRHSDRAVQMPTSASGNRLCRHQIPGNCSRWCSYKLFAKVILAAMAVLALICTGIYLASPEGQHRVHDVLLGVGLFLVIVIPGIVFLNSRERE
jgi:tellurite resistance protein TehA-like permease